MSFIQQTHLDYIILQVFSSSIRFLGPPVHEMYAHMTVSCFGYKHLLSGIFIKPKLKLNYLKSLVIQSLLGVFDLLH